MKSIILKGLATDNLKNLDLEIPVGRLTAVSGPAGAGKSALVLRTLLATGRSRYLDSVSSERQILSNLEYSAVYSEISGLPASVGLQLRPEQGERRFWSQVIGLDLNLRLLFSARADFCCPGCSFRFRPLNLSQVIARGLALPGDSLLVSFPSRQAPEILRAAGFSLPAEEGKRAGPPGRAGPGELREVFVDRLPLDQAAAGRLHEALESILAIGGNAVRLDSGRQRILLALASICPSCQLPSFPAREKTFSLAAAPARITSTGRNSGRWSISRIEALLKPRALLFRWGEYSFAGLLAAEIAELADFLEAECDFSGEQPMLAEVQRDLSAQLQLLKAEGLAGLSLAEPLAGLSRPEQNRILLCPFLARPPHDLLLVLEHPSAGLPRVELESLLGKLRLLLQAGNTLVMIENHPLLLAAADRLIRLGPSGGAGGGFITGLSPDQVESGRPERIRPRNSGGELILVPYCGLGKNNLSRFAASSPAGQKNFRRISSHPSRPPKTAAKRENLAGRLGLLPNLRRLFASCRQARLLGLLPGHFSSSSARGRCPACSGRGRLESPLKGLPGPVSPCEECRGSGLNPEILQVRWQGLSFAELLAQPMDQLPGAVLDQALQPYDRSELDLLGLLHLPLGRTADRLSLGEVQKIKLLNALAPLEAPALYLLDSPAACLDLAEINSLAELLGLRADQGHTLVCGDDHPAWPDLGQFFWTRICSGEELNFPGRRNR